MTTAANSSQNKPSKAPVLTTPQSEAKQAKTGLRAFLCHSSGDKDAVHRLYKSLSADGFLPRLDEEDLIAGQLVTAARFATTASLDRHMNI